MDSSKLLHGYGLQKLTVGVLGGHSALDVCHGAKRHGFETVCIAKKGREETYGKYYRTRKGVGGRGSGVGCVDDVISVNNFSDVLDEKIQEDLRKRNTIFVHNRYFWVYFDAFAKVENDFNVPIFGSRSLLKLEERDQPYNQYHLLADAGIRTPKIFKSAKEIDRLCLIKASEAKRGYERAFFLASDQKSWESEGSRLEKEGAVGPDWRDATIEEFIVGAPVNFNYFYSPLNQSRGSGSGQALISNGLELMGTDTRRQTNLDGFLRMTADQQGKAMKHVPLKMIETGHIAVTVKESILEKAFELGEKFVKATQSKKCDPSGRGIIGPFALQGAVVAEDGKEDIIIFDVSLRIPGSPGTFATPYSRYLYGEAMSVGERIGLELRNAVEQDAVAKIIT